MENGTEQSDGSISTELPVEVEYISPPPSPKAGAHGLDWRGLESEG